MIQSNKSLGQTRHYKEKKCPPNLRWSPKLQFASVHCAFPHQKRKSRDYQRHDQTWVERWELCIAGKHQSDIRLKISLTRLLIALIKRELLNIYDWFAPGFTVIFTCSNTLAADTRHSYHSVISYYATVTNGSEVLPRQIRPRTDGLGFKVQNAGRLSRRWLVV